MLRISHRARVAVCCALGAVTLAFAAPAFAGGKGTVASSGNSLSVVNVSVPGATPSYGQTITFKVTSTSSSPYVQLNCSQNSVVVYQHQAGFYAGYPWPNTYVLSSNYWTSGSANCTATLEHNGHNRVVVDATLAFTVNA
jgi:hypothetical protein